MIDLRAQSKAEILEDYIVKEILPKYEADTKIPSELAMAKELNTSRTTIHKIFSNLTAKGLLYRKEGLGTFISSVRPQSETSKIITAVCGTNTWHDPSMNASWFNTQFLLEGFSKSMQEDNYSLNILYLHPDDQSLEKGIDILLNTNSDGFIFPSLGGFGRHVSELSKKGKVCVVRSLDPFSDSHCVYGLIEDSFYDAMSYLIEHDRKKIVFLANANRFTDKKLKGVIRAMKEHGLNSDGLIELDVKAGFEIDGYRTVNKFIREDQQFDAILSVTDRLAFGAAMALEDAEIKVPEDVALIGSDNLAECLTMAPQIASITSDYHETGELMFKIMDKALNNPDMEFVCEGMKRTFIPRESCGG